MLTKTITYTDYNGNTRTEDYYFNITKAELMEMQLSTSGGLAENIQKITSALDIPAIVALFKTLIIKSYGEKSPDGKYFDKSEELSRRFAATEAFSQLYMELVSDSTKAAAFINGIIPADIAKQVATSPLMPDADGRIAGTIEAMKSGM